jgi:DNA-binding beta-propeller fold protein YncE
VAIDRIESLKLRVEAAKKMAEDRLKSTVMSDAVGIVGRLSRRLRVIEEQAKQVDGQVVRANGNEQQQRHATLALAIADTAPPPPTDADATPVTSDKRVNSIEGVLESHSMLVQSITLLATQQQQQQSEAVKVNEQTNNKASDSRAVEVEVKRYNYKAISAADCKSFDIAAQYPYGCAYDHQSDQLVVSSDGDYRLHVYNASNGTLIRSIGNGQGSDIGQLNSPAGLTISKDGRVFVCDYYNKRIQSFDLQTGAYKSHFDVESNPVSIVQSLDGSRLFISLPNSSQVREYSIDGQLIGQFGSKGDQFGQLMKPTGLAVDKTGTQLFVADRAMSRVTKFDVASRQYISHFDGPFGGNYWVYLAIDSNNCLIISDGYNSHSLKFYDANYQPISTFGSHGSQLGQFNCPYQLAFDEQHNRLFVCDQYNHRVQSIQLNTLN